MTSRWRRLPFAAWTAVAVLAAAGCDEPNVPTGPTTATVTVTGRVLEYLTMAPVAHASLRFEPELPDTPGGPVETTTDANGAYVVTLRRGDPLTAWVDGAVAGTVRVTGPGYRGDLFVRAGSCVSRYGLIVDGQTLQPVAGAAVTLRETVVTGSDGWYRIDLGCPDAILPGGTTVIQVTHPGYESRTQVVGRGVAGVLRLDLDLHRR